MNETTTSTTTTSRPPMMRAATLPAIPTSPLATNPWYRQKFELYRDVIEEKVRDEYPSLPHMHKLEPASVEHSIMKGYDLDFPIELHDGQSIIASISYGNRPPYSKEERRKLVTIRQNTTNSA